MRGQRINLVGQRFGTFIVLRVDRYDHRGSYWLCKCDCGKDFVRRADSIKSKSRSKSCGCVPANPKGSPHPPLKLPFGEGECRRHQRHYVAHALRRGLAFELDIATFREISQRPCHYCGIEPQPRKVFHGCNGPFIGNGIDRVDNDRGYFPDNCVPCCEVCNKAKRTLSLREFAQWVTRLARHSPTWVPQALAVPEPDHGSIASNASEVLPSASPTLLGRG
jgi:hypothetical protein